MTPLAESKHVDNDDKDTVVIRNGAYETWAVVINESSLYSLREFGIMVSKNI